MNIIIGCKEGKIWIFSRVLGKKSREKTFEAYDVEGIKKYVYSWYHRYYQREGVTLMASSTMDFPKAEGVMKSQVALIMAELTEVRKQHKEKVQ